MLLVMQMLGFAFLFVVGITVAILTGVDLLVRICTMIARQLAHKHLEQYWLRYIAKQPHLLLCPQYEERAVARKQSLFLEQSGGAHFCYSLAHSELREHFFPEANAFPI